MPCGGKTTGPVKPYGTAQSMRIGMYLGELPEKSGLTIKFTVNGRIQGLRPMSPGNCDFAGKIMDANPSFSG